MIVYVDLVFLLNLVIDGGLLVVTAWVRGVRLLKRRLLAGAVIGASYAAMMFFPPVSFLFTFALKVGLSLLMLWATFGFGGLQPFARHVAAFYGVNFAAAGAVLGGYYLLQSSSELWNGLWFTRSGGLGLEMNLGLVLLFILLAAGLLIYKSVLTARRQREQVISHVADVTVYIEDKECRCTGLVDTGNHLYDPLTRIPVMVMEAALWQDELPPSWLARIRESEVDKLVSGIGEESWIWQDRLRLIPYRGINRGTQFMLALKPDRVRIEQEGRTIETHRVLIGLDGGKLSADDVYQAIIHPSLISESKESSSQ
ncbi:sigma-E processing peptidase SpoIIGA [Paenibacillus daejeonensis]|uniref:sigma-E processing peptidase SpoIIGA n=1 Tax=Paenibacillus daejeonensis TaxID=135193 RepID=UPI000476D170|nr:sigma-E processing peptidase SpoIIGA [Paenibacillus daejeonensis]